MVPDSTTDREPDRKTGWTPLHESTPEVLDVPEDARGRHGAAESSDSQVAETGTTVVGLVADGSVVLAADRRASVGGGRFVTSKDVRKVEGVHPTAAAALSGTVGHIQHFVRLLRAESRLYEDRRGDPPTMQALSTLAGGVLRQSPLRVSPLLGGVDADGAHVFELDGGGGVLSDAYAAGGSGMQVAYGVLERRYRDDLSIEEARRVAAAAIDGASERDTASGNGFTVATVDAEGVAVEEFAALGEVA